MRQAHAMQYTMNTVPVIHPLQGRRMGECAQLSLKEV